MTFKQYFEKELESQGMFPQQAKDVMVSVIENDDTMNERWFEDVKGYPEALGNILRITVHQEATKYLIIHCPEAWNRPIFDVNHPLRKEFEAMNKG